MIDRTLYFKDGVVFANGYERVVHGKRGDYVELKKEQIKVDLVSHFKQNLSYEQGKEPFYYFWMEPIGRNEKIYYQIKTVNYADYKIGFYYISPKLLMFFDECKELF